MVAKSEQRALLEAMTPGRVFRAVTPNDSADLPDGACKGIYVGTQGNLVVIGADDSAAVTLVAAIGWLPVCAKRIKSGGTSASDIVAIY